MKKFLALGTLVALAVFDCNLGFAQSSKELKEIKKEIEALKNGQTVLERDLLEIRNLLLQRELQAAKDALQARPAPPAPAQAPTPAPAPAQAPTQVLNIDGSPFKGDTNAKVTLVEFTDYQCPFCGRHFRDTLPQIDTDYVKTGKVKYVLKEFPLEPIHPQAFKAAEAANCAGEQGKYWEMHDRLFSNQNGLAPEQLPGHAQALGLDAGKFKSCLDSAKYASRVRKNLVEAETAGATGTPTFFIGLTDPKSSEIKPLKKIVGAQTYATFKDALDTLLAQKE